MKHNNSLENRTLIPLAPFEKGEYSSPKSPFKKISRFYAFYFKKNNLENIHSLIPPFQRGLGGFPLGILSIFLIFLSSCMDDDKLNTPLKTYQEQGVFILNEGNFTYSNASLSYYKPDSGITLNDVFYNTNNLPLGDVAQSMCIEDSLAYIVLNNSGKVYIINKNTFKYTGKITGLSSPRHMLFINSAKAYISDLYNATITIVDPLSESIIGYIPTSGHASTEQMLLYNNKAYVNCWSYDNTILVINTETDQVEDSIIVGKQPNSMAIDKNNHLWVLSDGGFPGSSYGQENASLTQIDLSNHQIVKTLIFDDMNASPTHLKCNAEGDSLFYIYGNWGTSLANSGIYAMSISDSNLPNEAIIEQNNSIFYALGIDPSSKDIYVSNAKDYSQNGEIYRFSGHGIAKDTFEVGITPGFFYFDQ